MHFYMNLIFYLLLLTSFYEKFCMERNFLRNMKAVQVYSFCEVWENPLEILESIVIEYLPFFLNYAIYRIGGIASLWIYTKGLCLKTLPGATSSNRMAALPSRKQNRDGKKIEAVKNRVKFLTEKSVKTYKDCPCS